MRVEESSSLLGVLPSNLDHTVKTNMPPLEGFHGIKDSSAAKAPDWTRNLALGGVRSHRRRPDAVYLRYCQHGEDATGAGSPANAVPTCVFSHDG